MEVKNSLREAERASSSVGGLGGQAGEVQAIEPKVGQVTQQQYSLEGVTSDTADLINDLALKLKRVTHAAHPSSSELKSGKADKPLVGMASDLEKILNQALANRDALRNLLERIDL